MISTLKSFNDGNLGWFLEMEYNFTLMWPTEQKSKGLRVGF